MDDAAALAELLALREEHRALAARIEALEQMLTAMPANDDQPLGPADRPSPDTWYVKHVATFLAQDRRPSLRADWHGLLRDGYDVTREDVRALRRKYAPSAWHRPGQWRQKK